MDQENIRSRVIIHYQIKPVKGGYQICFKHDNRTIKSEKFVMKNIGYSTVSREAEKLFDFDFTLVKLK